MLLYLCFQSSHMMLFSCSLNLQTSHQVQWFSRISIWKSSWWGGQAGVPSGFGFGKGSFLQNGSPVRFSLRRSLAVDWKGGNYLKVSVRIDLFSFHVLFSYFRPRDGTLEIYAHLPLVDEKSGNSEKNSNGAVHPVGMFSKKGNT